MLERKRRVGAKFDAAEDEKRWARLSAEMDELKKELDAHESVYGKF